MAAFPGIRTPAFARAVPPKPKLRILDEYVLREMAGPFAFALAAFFLFWFANIFVLAADYIVNKGASPFLVMRFLVFRIPQATPLAFPFACLFGTLLGFGRLAADNEISAMRTSGVPFRRIIFLPVLAGLAVTVVSFLVNEKIAPVTTELSTRSFYQIIPRRSVDRKDVLRPIRFFRRQDDGERDDLRARSHFAVPNDHDRQERAHRRDRHRPRAPDQDANQARRTDQRDQRRGARRSLLAADGRQRSELSQRRDERYVDDGLEAPRPGHQVPQRDRTGRDGPREA
jgi:lipopolysaccharide export LptBFGC system permease protein LptF